MSDYDTEAGKGVMIALLPITTDWCKLEVPHMTLVYAGEVDDLPEMSFNDLAKDAAMLAMLSHPIQLKVKGKEIFGSEGEEKVDVFRLQSSSELMAMRRAVEKWNASQWPFNPHVTIGPTGTFMEFPPTHLAFDRICVGWGGEYLTFWLKR